MIDRRFRDEAAAALEDYLQDRISAFQLDERLMGATQDGTADLLIQEVWSFYDDNRDHLVCLSRTEWDFLQRLLLILRSDIELGISASERRWTTSNMLAIGLLFLFAGAAISYGWSIQLLLVTASLGVISILISHANEERLRTKLSTREIAQFPFQSLAQIREAKRRVPGFKKTRYRQEIQGRRIRGTVSEALLKMTSCLLRLVFGPVALLAQAIPSRGQGTVLFFNLDTNDHKGSAGTESIKKLGAEAHE